MVNQFVEPSHEHVVTQPMAQEDAAYPNGVYDNSNGFGNPGFGGQAGGDTWGSSYAPEW
jgi:hypothetical protein